MKKTAAPPGLWQMLTREFAVQLAIFAIPIGVATAFAVFVFYHFDVQMVEHNLRETEHHHLILRDVMMRQNVEAAIEGLRLLASLHDPDALPGAGAGQGQRGLVASFAVFCRQFPHYRQIRSIARGGEALARVRCDADDGRAAQAPPPDARANATLQQALLMLAWEDVYVSGIVTAPEEDGARPVVRLATPLGRRDGAARTFVVVDMDLRRLISDVMLDTGQGGTMMLVEENGRFVRKPVAGERWGDTVLPGRELAFQRAYPQVWGQIQRASSGEVETPAGLFTFLRLELAEVLNTRRGGAAAGPPASGPVWRIVSHVPRGMMVADRSASIRKVLLLIPAPLLVALYLAHVGVRRRRAARRLEESETYLRQIMDSVVDGIVTTDPAGRIERANAAVEALFGFASPEDVPMELVRLVPLEQLPPEGDLARLWRGERVQARLVHAELNLRRKDGTEFPAELLLTEAVLGGSARFVWIIRDISERQAFEAKQNAERMRFFHQTKMAEIGLIAAGIIHEVGNPIAAISGMVSEIAEEAGDGSPDWSAQAREKLELMAHHTQRLAGITREISDFVRTRRGVVELFDLNSLVRGTLRLVAYDSRWKGIRLDVKLDGEIPAIMGIQDQLAQVLMNLLVNAGDAVQDRPAGERWVAVRTENRGTHVLLSVADNGHGMSEETQRRAFDSFYTTKPEGKGTGLGLSLCQTIVAAHQGAIELESSDGAGAAFRILLPVPEQAQPMAG